jgi:hypothetical protein
LNRRIRESYRGIVGVPEEVDQRVEWWSDFSPVPGVPRNLRSGLIFTTTLHAAAWISHRLSYNPILLVGFDCTQGRLHDNPHWYDEGRTGKYNPRWDSQMGCMADYFKSIGTELYNISPVTEATITPHMSMEEAIARYF